MKDQNANKQLIVLFLASFVILFIGMGLFPILPLFAARLGATNTTIGIFFAVINASTAVGPMFAGLLAEKLGRKTLFIAVGALGVPALLLLGQATALWQVILLTSIVWFSGGLDLGLISIFTGLYATENSRGKSFTLMALAGPLGALVGGTTIGQLIEWQGYGLLFSALGIFWAILPILGILVLQDTKESVPAASAPKIRTETRRFGQTFYLLLVASLLSSLGINISRLGTSLSMQSLDFSAATIASSATVSGLISIPVAILVGALSDRLGRRGFLMLGYLLAAGGTLVLSGADQLWQFWLAATLTMVAFSLTGAMGSALATDLLSPGELNRGMSWFNTASSAASVLSFASSGYLLDMIGSQALYLLAATLPVIAASVFELPPNLASLKQLRLGNKATHAPESSAKINNKVCTANC
jgi:MFS family permease